MSALSFAAAQMLRALPRQRVGQFVGRLADHPWSPTVGKLVVQLYSRAYDVNFDDCEKQDGWQNFDEFFTRRLRSGARPIASAPRMIVSPADGRVESMGRIDASSKFTVKGVPYSVGELLDDAEEAKRFVGGAGCVIYLSPRDYHRVHSPVDGVIRRVRSLPGDYFPVNSIGMRHIANLFARNRRVVIEIDTPMENALGRVVVVMVVAMIVGRITVTGIDARDVPFGRHRMDPPLRVARGAEMGIFHLGSTAVVLVERCSAGTRMAEPGPIRLGQPLVRAHDFLRGIA